MLSFPRFSLKRAVRVPPAAVVGGAEMDGDELGGAGTTYSSINIHNHIERSCVRTHITIIIILDLSNISQQTNNNVQQISIIITATTKSSVYNRNNQVTGFTDRFAARCCESSGELDHHRLSEGRFEVHQHCQHRDGTQSVLSSTVTTTTSSCSSITATSTTTCSILRSRRCSTSSASTYINGGLELVQQVVEDGGQEDLVAVCRGAGAHYCHHAAHTKERLDSGRSGRSGNGS